MVELLKKRNYFVFVFTLFSELILKFCSFFSRTFAFVLFLSSLIACANSNGTTNDAHTLIWLYSVKTFGDDGPSRRLYVELSIRYRIAFSNIFYFFFMIFHLKYTNPYPNPNFNPFHVMSAFHSYFYIRRFAFFFFFFSFPHRLSSDAEVLNSFETRCWMRMSSEP